MTAVEKIERALVEIARQMRPFSRVGRIEGEWIAEFDEAEDCEVNLTRMAELLALELEASP